MIKKRLLIVDDSALMRRHLSKIFEAEGDFEICLARNGKEAVIENENFQPDVITLDINMPEMDGLTALSIIMTKRPVPVIMISSLTEKGALATFEALNLGAIDYIAKPDGTISLTIDKIRHVIIDKVRGALKANIRNHRRFLEKAKVYIKDKEKIRYNLDSSTTNIKGLVIIGVSTGGPHTLESILTKLPADYPLPILVTQHMPKNFTKPFAERLNKACAISVIEVNQPTLLQSNCVYIAKGGTDMVLSRRKDKLIVLPKPEDSSFLWHPSVEALGRSILKHYNPKQVIAVMLTGMGYDGAEAFAEIKYRGGRTIAESEDSAVVFGMPKELINRKGASLILPAYKIANQLIKWAN